MTLLMRRRILLVVSGFWLGILPVGAQGVQNELNRETFQVEQGMSNGAINAGQAQQLGTTINQINQQAQVERAANGGHLTPQEAQQLQGEMHGVAQNMRADAYHNGSNPQSLGMYGNGNGHRWHHQNFPGYNPQYAQYGQQGQGYYPYNGQGQYPNPNNTYVNGQPYYNNVNPGYNPYQNNAYQQQGGLSGARQLLQKLF